MLQINSVGPTLIAEWSDHKTLPLTASCYSPLFGFETSLELVRKLSVTNYQWELSVGFSGHSDFLYHLRIASHDLV